MKSDYKAIQRAERKAKRQADREDRRIRQQVRKAVISRGARGARLASRSERHV